MLVLYSLWLWQCMNSICLSEKDHYIKHMPKEQKVIQSVGWGFVCYSNDDFKMLSLHKFKTSRMFSTMCVWGGGVVG